MKIFLGNAYLSMGNSVKARDMYSDAIKMYQKLYGEDLFLTTLHGNFALVCGFLGGYNQQKSLLEKALIISEKHYGPDHSETVMMIKNLMDRTIKKLASLKNP